MKRIRFATNKQEEHTMKQYIKTGETITIDSYPYGRLRCKAFFSVEFSPKHGFRSVFQTINPKNGQLNAPKKGTYKPLMAAYLDTETGHAGFSSRRMYNGQDSLHFLSFLSEHEELFTDEQIEHLKIYALARMKQEASSLVRYCKVPVSEAIRIVEPMTRGLVDCIKNKTSVTPLVPILEQMFEDAEKSRQQFDNEAA